MGQVDFGYVGSNGLTIYVACFMAYVRCRYEDDRPKAVWSKLVKQTEEVFDFLVKEGIKNEYDVESILEIPNSVGETCFSIASDFSEKICNYIIKRRIKVNSIRADMAIPKFTFSTLSSQMMKKTINPHVIDFYGASQVDDNPTSFKSEEGKQLLAKFPRSMHYSIEDIECPASCPANCPSQFKKFYSKNGPLVVMTDQNRIGSGGFGMVFKEIFHGKPMAMKCMPMRQIKWRYRPNDVVSALEKNISEIRIQMATSGSGIIIPVAFVRQQDQEKDANGKWIAKNYNIYIYPLYDCNLDEFHENYFDQFTEEMIADIIHQCFIRTGSDPKII